MNLNKLFSHAVGLFAVATICGCATGAKFTTARPAQPDTARVYVFRPSAPPLALKPTIIVNGVKAADLTNKGYLDLELRPGVYDIKADWSWSSGVPDGEFMLQAKRGQTYYVMIDSSMHTTGYVANGVTVIPIIRFKGGIGIVNHDEAMAMIAPCGAVKKVPAVEELMHPR